MKSRKEHTEMLEGLLETMATRNNNYSDDPMGYVNGMINLINEIERRAPSDEAEVSSDCRESLCKDQ